MILVMINFMCLSFNLFFIFIFKMILMRIIEEVGKLVRLVIIDYWEFKLLECPRIESMKLSSFGQLSIFSIKFNSLSKPSSY
jgi:hypothetical protein